MKLTKVLTAAALVVLSAACAKEQVAAPEEGEVLVTFSVASPALQTKAIADGNTVDKVSCNVYTSDGATRYTALCKEVDMTNGKATFTVALAAGQTYDFCFWAYKDGQDAYKFDADAKTVKVSYDGALANDETRDAFYWYEDDLKVAGSLEKTITLYRPFAQVNLGTTAEDVAAAKTAGIEVSQSAISFTGLSDELDLTTGKVSGDVDADFAAAAIPTEKLTVKKADYAGTYEYLSFAYVLVGKGQKYNTDATFTLTTTKDPVEVKTTALPVQGNWRTNVLGCPTLLSSEATFNIVVDPAFDDEYVHPDTDLEKLQFVCANGGSVTLSSDVELTERLYIGGNKSVVVDLNGHSIVNKTDDTTINEKYPYTQVFYVTDDAQLTIKGDGEVKALGQSGDGYRQAVEAQLNAVVNIYGGSYYNEQPENTQIDLIYAAVSATINIYGGTFESGCYNDWGGYWVLNIQDKTDAKINVYGGTFVKFDPSNPKTKDGNLVAPGYSVVKDGDNYTVVEGTAVTTEAELKEALNAGGTVVLGADVTLSETLVVTGDAVLDLNGKTISNTNDIYDTDKWSLISVRESGNLTIKGNGAAKAKKDDCYAIDVFDKGASLTIEDGEFVGNITAIYVFEGKATLNGGTYSIQQLNTNNVEDSWGQTINLKNDNQDAGTASIVVAGGKYYKYDPSHATDGNHDGNLVAAGYKSVAEGDYYTVVAE